MADDAKTEPSRDLRGPRALALFAAVTAAGAALDLWTKDVAFTRIPPWPDKIEVIPHLFNLIRAENRGAAFSIMNGEISFFKVISVLALGLLGYFSWNAKGSRRGYQVILGMVAAGVIGNFVDRVRLGYVRDFLDVYVSQPGARAWLEGHFNTSHWPTFNVADMFICVGTGCLFVKFWGDEKRAAKLKETHDVDRPQTA